jgi:hypothetical protein
MGSFDDFYLDGQGIANMCLLPQYRSNKLSQRHDRQHCKSQRSYIIQRVNFQTLALVITPSSVCHSLAPFSLKRLIHRSSRPYDSIEDIIRDRPRQLRRSARKMLGLPASSDVGELAGMINGLRAAVEKYLGRPISAASITIPHLYALYQEDLEDAFEYLGLIYLDSWPYWQGGLLSET